MEKKRKAKVGKTGVSEKYDGSTYSEQHRFFIDRINPLLRQINFELANNISGLDSTSQTKLIELIRYGVCAPTNVKETSW